MIENINFESAPVAVKKEKRDRSKYTRNKNKQEKKQSQPQENKFKKPEKKPKKQANQIEEKVKALNEESIPLPEQSSDNFSATTFDSLEINDYLKKALSKAEMTTMTKVQKKAIPTLLKHKNVVVKSETGSGKTLCYAVPLYQHLFEKNQVNPIKRTHGVHAIIFAPTHELCLQIEQTLNKLRSSCINAVYGCLMGGQKMQIEKTKLRKGLNVLICTPSRLLYHIQNTYSLNFDSLSMIILDEADVVLDLGFGATVKQIFDHISGETETLDWLKSCRISLVSATIDQRIRELASFLMTGFKTVGLDSKTEKVENIPKGLNQFYLPTFDEFKLLHLIALLSANDGAKSIIFVHTCEQANFLHDLLQNLKVNGNKLFEHNFLKLHGKMKHNERNEIFTEFRKAEKVVLVATDVASRGLDFPEVSFVYQYDVNPNPKEYINRMGRTARLTSKGSSVLFLLPHERQLLDGLLAQFDLKELSNEDCMYHLVKSKEFVTQDSKYGSQEVNDGDENEAYRKKFLFVLYPLQMAVKEALFSGDKDLLFLARRAFKSNLRAYAMLNKVEKNIFHIKNLNLSRYVDF